MVIIQRLLPASILVLLIIMKKKTSIHLSKTRYNIKIREKKEIPNGTLNLKV